MYITIINVIDQTLLYQTSIDDAESAYTKAREFEEMGLDVSLNIPSVSSTLIKALGANDSEMALHHQSIFEEIIDHPCDCQDP